MAKSLMEEYLENRSDPKRENVLTRLKEKGESLKRSLFTKPEILQEAE